MSTVISCSYVTLPETVTRASILKKLLDKHESPLTKEEIKSLARYSVQTALRVFQPIRMYF